MLPKPSIAAGLRAAAASVGSPSTSNATYNTHEPRSWFRPNPKKEKEQKTHEYGAYLNESQRHARVEKLLKLTLVASSVASKDEDPIASSSKLSPAILATAYHSPGSLSNSRLTRAYSTVNIRQIRQISSTTRAVSDGEEYRDTPAPVPKKRGRPRKVQKPAFDPSTKEISLEQGVQSTKAANLGATASLVDHASSTSVEPRPMHQTTNRIDDYKASNQEVSVSEDLGTSQGSVISTQRSSSTSESLEVEGSQKSDRIDSKARSNVLESESPIVSGLEASRIDDASKMREETSESEAPVTQETLHSLDASKVSRVPEQLTDAASTQSQQTESQIASTDHQNSLQVWSETLTNLARTQNITTGSAKAFNAAWRDMLASDVQPDLALYETAMSSAASSVIRFESYKNIQEDVHVQQEFLRLLLAEVRLKYGPSAPSKLETYETVLRAFAVTAMAQETMQVLEMSEARSPQEHKPTPHMFESLIILSEETLQTESVKTIVQDFVARWDKDLVDRQAPIDSFLKKAITSLVETGATKDANILLEWVVVHSLRTDSLTLAYIEALARTLKLHEALVLLQPLLNRIPEIAVPCATIKVVFDALVLQCRIDSAFLSKLTNLWYTLLTFRPATNELITDDCFDAVLHAHTTHHKEDQDLSEILSLVDATVPCHIPYLGSSYAIQLAKSLLRAGQFDQAVSLLTKARSLPEQTDMDQMVFALLDAAEKDSQSDQSVRKTLLVVRTLLPKDKCTPAILTQVIKNIEKSLSNAQNGVALLPAEMMETLELLARAEKMSLATDYKLEHFIEDVTKWCAARSFRDVWFFETLKRIIFRYRTPAIARELWKPIQSNFDLTPPTINDATHFETAVNVQDSTFAPITERNTLNTMIRPQASSPSVKVDHVRDLVVDSKFDESIWGRISYKKEVMISLCDEVITAAKEKGIVCMPRTLTRIMIEVGRAHQPSRLFELYGIASRTVVDRAPPGQGPDMLLQFNAWYLFADAMISACSLMGRHDLAYDYRRQIISQGAVPSATAYGNLINSVRDNSEDAEFTQQIWKEVQLLGCTPNTFLYNSVLSKLSVVRRFEQLYDIFRQMKESGEELTAITYGTIISACCRLGNEQMALELFEEMESTSTIRPRASPFNTMMQFYVKEMEDRDQCLVYFKKLLQAGLKPTDHTYSVLLQAYGLIEPVDNESLMDVFETVSKDRQIGVSGHHWSTMIRSVGLTQGKVDEALTLFESIASHPNNASAYVQPDKLCYEAIVEVLYVAERYGEMERYIQRMDQTGIVHTTYVEHLRMQLLNQGGDLAGARALFWAMPPTYVANGHGWRDAATWELMIRMEMKEGNTNEAEGLVQQMSQNPLFSQPIITSMYNLVRL